MLYEVTYMVRRNGAIGVFVPCPILVEAESEEQARERAFAIAHESGYETSHVAKVTTGENMSKNTIYECDLGPETVDISKWEYYKVHGYMSRRRVKIGERTGKVRLLIDTSKLKHLVRRALRSKNGQATLASRGIVLKVIPATVTEVSCKPPVFPGEKGASELTPLPKGMSKGFMTSCGRDAPRRIAEKR